MTRQRATAAARVALIAALMVVQPFDSWAQSNQPPSLADISLEDLIQIEITTVSRKQERAGDVAAAIYVITAEEIRRSGMTSVPELFRLVPGMTVSRINSNNWAISVRGFGSLFTNKLLVLVDGRSIYNRTFSGELWNSLDLPLDDIEHIEVIRGPGGSVWGTNAVNGVINIITKSAAETQGVHVRVGVGTFDTAQGGVRYGGSRGRASYRLYSQWTRQDDSLLDPDRKAGDGWYSATNGFRVDWASGADTATVQAGLVTGEARPLWRKLASPIATPTVVDSVASTRNGAILGRWTRTRGSGSSLELQAFMDLRHRDDDDVKEAEHVYDLHGQYQMRLGSQHALVAGGGYRNVDARLDGSFAFSMNPAVSESGVVNLFIQDDIAVGTKVQVTFGAKLEHDSEYGWNMQPTARAMWTVVPSQRLWMSASRAVRTPSNRDRYGTTRYAAFPGAGGIPVVLAFVGNPDYEAEHLISIESGYRAQLGGRAAVDVAIFQGQYDHLQTLEPVEAVFEASPSPPHLLVATQYRNLLAADTRGLELSAQWQPLGRLRVEGSYSLFHLTPHPDPQSRDETAAGFDGNAPSAQWQVRSTVGLGPRVEATAGLFHVGSLERRGVPAHTRADARVALKASASLSIVGTGQNLFDPTHAEYAGFDGVLPTLVPRSATLQLVRRF